MRSSGIHLSAILLEIPQLSVTEISLKITDLKFCLNLPGANELKMVCQGSNSIIGRHGKIMAWCDKATSH